MMETQRRIDLRRWLRSKQIPLSIIGVVRKWADEREAQEGVKVADSELLAEAERLCEEVERLSHQLPGGERVPVELKIEKLGIGDVAWGVAIGFLGSVAALMAVGGLILWALAQTQ